MMKNIWDSLATTIVQSLARMVFSLLTGAHFFACREIFLGSKLPGMWEENIDLNET